MKIQLERKLTHHPYQLACAVCCQPFAVPQIRSLLFTDRGWLQGDVCPNCLKLGTEGIRQTMRDRAILLNKQSEYQQSNTIAVNQLATELMTCAQETVKFPSLWQWWFRWWEVLQAETVALETARWHLSARSNRRHCPKSSWLKGQE